MATNKHALLLRKGDNAAVLTGDAEPGDSIKVTGSAEFMLEAKTRVPKGHKVALEDLAAGAAVVKYGLPIGKTMEPVARGSWLHGHNLGTALHGDMTYAKPAAPFEWKDSDRVKTLLAAPSSRIPKTFLGYRRKDGTVGTRNEIWILPVVGCVNKTAENLAAKARAEFGVDCFAYTHPYGCSQLGDDLGMTAKVLSRLARHPNAAGTLVLSLGCENLKPEIFKAALGTYDTDRVRFLSMQECGDETAEGMKLLGELAAAAEKAVREPVPLSELAIGVKCGGSDAFSGITANPLVGNVTDFVVALGGSAVMTEVPEMFGAETRLMERSASSEVFDGIVRLINGFKDYFISHGQEVYENPSPGNRDGGITTLEEKSLGGINKTGSVPVVDVLGYGESIRRKGLTLLQGPGNDLVSTTNLTASGCQVILFTTGRGTPFGAPVPTLKISTNEALALHKPGWIDFDASTLLRGTAFDDAGLDLLKLVIATAEGSETKAETSGFRDIAIWKDGVTL